MLTCKLTYWSKKITYDQQTIISVRNHNIKKVKIIQQQDNHHCRILFTNSFVSNIVHHLSRLNRVLGPLGEVESLMHLLGKGTYGQKNACS